MVLQYIPAGHLLRINYWRRAQQISDWYNTASNAFWIVSSIFDPVNTGLRYIASKAGVQMPFAKLQQNIILWFYTAYVHRLGTYLIDLNSGRLKVGATRYRQLLQAKKAAEEVKAGTQPEAPALIRRNRSSGDAHLPWPGESGQVESHQRHSWRATGENSGDADA